jgi:hypothetical protein
VLDQCCRRRFPLAGRQAPRLLHILRVHAHDRADVLALRGHPRIRQLAGTAAAAHPLGRRLGGSVCVGDVNVATKADHVAEPQLSEIGEQLLIAKAVKWEGADKQPWDQRLTRV